VLFSVGGLFALYEAYHKWQHPEPITAWRWLPIVVLVVSIILEGSSFRTAIMESNAIRGKSSWARFIRRAKAPELPVVLLEDFAALIGLLFALAGVSLTLVTDNGRWDAFGSAMIGLLLVTVAVVLAIETKSLLLGEAASDIDIAKIKNAILAGHEAERIIHMRTLHLGPEDILVAAKIAIHHDDTARAIATGIDAIERRIREAVPTATLIYIEPDIYRQPAPQEVGE
jgi:divalent metal cation (Fe/Co/Zn/Cd) transporter